MEIEIQKKPPKEYKKDIQVKSTTDVVELEEIKEIRNAMQENMILIGLDRGNHIRTLKLMGLGTNRYIEINSKDILRTALISGSDSIILVHNHPSNSLKASSEDLHFTRKKSCNILPVEIAVKKFPQALYIITNYEYFDEMWSQLIGLGISRDKILIYTWEKEKFNWKYQLLCRV